MKKTVLRLGGSYSSTKESIYELIQDINYQIVKVKQFGACDKVIDLSHLFYIDSNISVVLFAYLRFLESFYVKTPGELLIVGPTESKLQKHFNKNNFCCLWGCDPEIDENDTIIKISENRTSFESVKILYKDLYRMLKKLNMGENEINKFIASLAELCTNAFEHGGCQILYMSGQFYPQKHELNFTIFNFGRTFKSNTKSFISQKKLMPISYTRKFNVWIIWIGFTNLYGNIKKV